MENNNENNLISDSQDHLKTEWHPWVIGSYSVISGGFASLPYFFDKDNAGEPFTLVFALVVALFFGFIGHQLSNM